MTDGITTPNTTRAMGLVPVTAHQATSVVGHSPEIDGEYVVTRLNSIMHKDATARTSGGQKVYDYLGTTPSQP
jgi:hypothetical protein